jgi:acyl-CoA thioesterase FadM
MADVDDEQVVDHQVVLAWMESLCTDRLRSAPPDIQMQTSNT